MAKLSGIVLIIAAILDLLAGIVYLGGGAVTQIVTGIGTSTIEQRAGSSGLNEAQQLEIAQMLASGAWESGALFAFGVFLLAAAVVLIMAARRLFRRRTPHFVYWAAGIALLAEAGGIYLLGFKLLNVPGLLGGVLAVVAAARLTAAPATPTQAR